jgi:hypothetical protein
MNTAYASSTSFGRNASASSASAALIWSEVKDYPIRTSIVETGNCRKYLPAISSAWRRKESKSFDRNSGTAGDVADSKRAKRSRIASIAIDEELDTAKLLDVLASFRVRLGVLGNIDVNTSNRLGFNGC